MNSYSQSNLCYKKFGKNEFLLGFSLKINKMIDNSNLAFQQISRSTYIMPLTVT